MKNIAIRSLVLVLAIVGFSASSISSASAARTARASEAKTMVLHPGVVGNPTPLCNPNGSQGLCGID